MRVRQVAAIGRYEFLMQVRKRSLWLVTAALAALSVIVQDRHTNPLYIADGVPGAEVLARWSVMFGLLLPIAFGFVLADRAVRDYRLGTAHLLDSLPPGAGARMAGKYLGGVAASGLPILLAMLVVGGYESAHRGSLAMLGWALVAFALVLLPGLLFVAGFALTCPMLVTAPLFRILFVGYWVWASMVGPDMLPSTSGTLLAPIGAYPASWLAHERLLFVGEAGWLSFLRPAPGVVATVVGSALLIGLGLLPVLVAGRIIERRVKG